MAEHGKLIYSNTWALGGDLTGDGRPDLMANGSYSYLIANSGIVSAGSSLSERLTHTFTGSGQELSLVADGQESYVNYTRYRDDGLLSGRVLGYYTPVSRGYSYNAQRQLNRLDAYVGGTTVYGTGSYTGGSIVQNDHYAYDKVGNITVQSDYIGQQSQCFGYDTINRLTVAFTLNYNTSCPVPNTSTATYQPTAPPDPYAATWAYNSIDNITATTLGLPARSHPRRTATRPADQQQSARTPRRRSPGPTTPTTPTDRAPQHPGRSRPR